jgi:catechol 2,3-dioxygenase-like lactoylglutathione lyase family enzyme
MTTSIRHHHSALHVQSLERSASFYADGLGLQRVQAWRSGPYIGELFARPGVGVSALMVATQDDAFQFKLVQGKRPAARGCSITGKSWHCALGLIRSRRSGSLRQDDVPRARRVIEARCMIPFVLGTQ